MLIYLLGEGLFEENFLWLKVRDNKIGFVLLLLRILGSDYAFSLEEGLTPLMFAIREGYCDLVMAMIEELSQAQLDARGLDGQTALMVAAGDGQEQVVHALLARGCNPKLVDNDGSTALIVAAKSGSNPCIKELGNGNVDLAYEDSSSRTALVAAAENGHKQTVLLLLSKGAQLPNSLLNPVATRLLFNMDILLHTYSNTVLTMLVLRPLTAARISVGKLQGEVGLPLELWERIGFQLLLLVDGEQCFKFLLSARSEVLREGCTPKTLNQLLLSIGRVREVYCVGDDELPSIPGGIFEGIERGINDIAEKNSSEIISSPRSFCTRVSAFFGV